MALEYILLMTWQKYSLWQSVLIVKPGVKLVFIWEICKKKSVHFIQKLGVVGTGAAGSRHSMAESGDGEAQNYFCRVGLGN